MYYAFKTNPKQLVVDKAKNLFGKQIKVNVSGRRPDIAECKDMFVPVGTYFVICTVDSKQIATANAKNWRTAYKLLVIEVEKAFEKSLFQQQS